MIGRLFRGGELLADNVECRITPDNRRVDNLPGWRGEAWLPIDVVLLPGAQLTLETNGGSSSNITVDRVVVDGSAGKMLVRFTGTGPLKPEGQESA